MIRFEFATAGRIVFGAGRIREAGALSRDLGKRALVVSGRNTSRASGLLTTLRDSGVDSVVFPVPGEPALETVRQAVSLARQDGCDMVVGFGGGSALDAGKAVAAMLTNTGDLLDYLEVIGAAKPLANPPAPFVAIPTTAGTGSEVTRNAVLFSPDHRLKVSLRSPSMLPRIALIDPELTYDLPPTVTAFTGLDALTQLIEPLVCSRANPFTDALCSEALPRVGRSLPAAFQNGSNAKAREDMALASLFGGLALANAGLGAVHGFAGPIGGMFPAPHGAICAALLPHVMQTNSQALRLRAPGSDALKRFDLVARLLMNNPQATAMQGIERVRALVNELRIPRLSSYGIATGHVAELVQKARQASSMKANPIELTSSELAETLERAL